MKTKVEIIATFAPLSLSEKLSILEALSEIVQQEIDNEKSCSEEISEGIDFDPFFLSPEEQALFEEHIEDEVKKEVEDPILHPHTGSIDWQENIEIESCPGCNGTTLIKWGKYRGQQRYRCGVCGLTFTTNSLTVSHGIKKTEEFESFGHSMFDGNYRSLSELSEELKINRSTAFNWRHKYLSAISVEPSKGQYAGTVEMDDIWFRLDEKGRKITGTDTVRPPIGAGDNDMQVKLLCCYERESKTLDAFVVRSGRLKQTDIESTVGKKFGKDSKIYSDKHQSIKAFTNKFNVEHHAFLAKEHAMNKDVHVQNLNGQASEMKNIFLRKMKGVATKYLQNYANWFVVNKRVRREKISSIEVINKHKNNQKSWDYYSNAERIYKRFLELYSRLEYINPVKKEWKSCLWNFNRICQVLI